MKLLLIALALAAAARAQLSVSGNVIRFTDGTNTVNAADNANNALRVNVVAGAGGGTSSSFGAAFPASGTAGGFSDGTNMQGGRVFDLDSGGGTIYVLGMNLRRTASGAATELIGQQTMADSLPVTIASNQGSFTVAATQSGTWTVQPGNTANTTAWLVKTVPVHGCSGNTVQDISTVNVATGAGSDLTTADTCVFRLYVNNKTSSAVNVTVEDRQGSPVNYATTFSLPGNSDRFWDFNGMKFTTGVRVIAGTATAINARLIGVQ
jgi:hypothetical protein